jgi:hypothetical protein
MAGSLVLAGRESNNSEKACRIGVLTFVKSYRDAMQQFAEMPMVDLARHQIFRHLNVCPC